MTMTEFDPTLLSRIQFAANISFHIIFPSITIALGWILLFFKLRYHATKDHAWIEAYFLFTKIFALSFAMGIVSGVTMSFQFGTNWPGFMETVGNIAGPLLAYEILTAFFLEATFLGIMLFGFRRASPWLHSVATGLVAIGTTMSAFWIVALNSWMHTPSGFEMIANETGQFQAHVTSWWEVIFNPSMPYRFTHMLLASGLTASFLMAGLSAYSQLKGNNSRAVKKSLKTSILLAAILIPFQIVAGHSHGINTKAYEPAKIASIEAAWETKKGMPLVLFAIPNEKKHKNDFAIEIPYIGSLILTHSIDGEIKGINDFKMHPPVKPLFFGFRIMVGIAILMLITSWRGAFFILKKKKMTNFYLYGLVCMAFSGTIATMAGWYVTEIGRQPWLVKDVLLVNDAVSDVSATMLVSSLFVYLIIYFFLTVTYFSTLFYMAKNMKINPKNQENKPSPTKMKSHIIT